MKVIFISICFFFALTGVSEAQPRLIKEITGKGLNLLNVDGTIFFTVGDSLMKTDGTTAGTVLVKNGLHFPGRFLADNGILFFVNDRLSDNSYQGKELWRSDGTTAGTYLLKAFNSTMLVLTTWNNIVYFTASTASEGRELYATNGTVAGTYLLKDINPGSANGYAGSHAGAGNYLYFSATDSVHGTELWKTNGTPSGTVLVKDIIPGSASGFAGYPGSLYGAYGIVYFTGDDGMHGHELWRSDGTTTGTFMVQDVIPGAAGNDNITVFAAYNNEVYWGRYFENPTEHMELWKTNQSGTNAIFLKDFSATFSEHELFGPAKVFNNKLYFFSNKYNFSESLWVTDGTTLGTKLIKDEVTIDGTSIAYMDVINDELVFYGASQGFFYNIYNSDGTPEGTTTFYNFHCSDGPIGLTNIDSLLFFSDIDGPSMYCSPYNPEDNFQLIQSDLSSMNTKSLRSILGPSASHPGVNSIAVLDNKIIFSTYNDLYAAPDSEKVGKLWIYDPFKPATLSSYFTLVNANTGEDIRWIQQGDTIYNRNTAPRDKYNIRFNPISNPASVVFITNDSIQRLENSAPFSLVGDSNGVYATWQALEQGNYKITAIPYSQANGVWTAGTPVTVEFYCKDLIEEPEPSIVFTLIDATTNTAIRDLNSEDTILYNPAFDQITIKAWSADEGNSMKFYLNDTLYRLDNTGTFPSLNGHENRIYNAWPAQLKAYTLRAVGYSGSNGTGAVTVERTIHFLVKQPTGQVSFTLVNAQSDQDISSLENGQIIDLSAIGTNQLNIRANSSMSGTSSVIFDYNGTTHFRVENTAPFALFADASGDYNAHTFSPGTYSLTATPYTGKNGTETTGLSQTITFYITEGSSNQRIATYPNPVENNMQVKFTSATTPEVYPAKLSIYTPEGKELYTGIYTDGNYNVNLSGLKMRPGLYLLKVETQKEVQIIKFIKK